MAIQARRSGRACAFGGDAGKCEPAPQLTPMPEWRTIQDLLQGFAAEDGSVAVLVFGGAQDESRTFAQLRDNAVRIARLLVARGFNPGATIGLMGANSLAWIESFLGIITVGCVAMPIDAQARDDDLRRMLAIAECRLVLASPEQINRLTGLAIEHAPLGLCGTELPAGHATAIAPIARPEDEAVLVFTSGTTGVPKAVPLTHANLMSNVMALRAEKIVCPGDHALLPLPLHHVYPLTIGLLTVLASGATVVLPAGLSGPQLMDAMRKAEVTALLGVPRLYEVLLTTLRAAIETRGRTAARLFPALLTLAGFVQNRLGLSLGYYLFRRLRAGIGPKLRLMVSGGAVLPLATEKALRALGWEVLTGYGLTETSPMLTFNRPLHPRIGTAGQALPGTRLRIANPGPDGIGEIQAAGAPVFSGYRKDDAATRAAFTPDGWFRTGDLGYLDADLFLHVTGRVTETIILPNGKKIDPEPLEAIYAADPVIRDIAIIGGPAGLVALVVPNEEELRESGTLRLRERIADALRARGRTLAPHLRPGGLAIVRTPLPRTAFGKLRRQLLPSLYESAAAQQSQPEPAYSYSASDSVVPADPLAGAVLQWLRQSYPGHKVELTTSPQLDLGLDSLGWIDLTLAMQQKFGISLTEQQIARVITVGDLLREAEAARANAPQAIGEANAETWLLPYGQGLRTVRAIGETLLRLIVRTGFRLHVEGWQHLPAPPFVICPNHVSYLDAFVLAAALPHRCLQNTYFAGWTGLLFATPLERLFSRAAQVVPVDPDRAVASSIANGVGVLRHGKILVWFPEGTISADGALQPFQPGIGAVLERQPVPVVPAWIGGARAALPPGKRLPRPYCVTVKFGPAIDVPTIAPASAGRTRQHGIADAIHQSVAMLAFRGAPDGGLAKKDQLRPSGGSAS